MNGKSSLVSDEQELMWMMKMMMMVSCCSQRLPRERKVPSEKPELQSLPDSQPPETSHPWERCQEEGQRGSPPLRRGGLSPLAGRREGAFSLEIVCPAMITPGPIL